MSLPATDPPLLKVQDIVKRFPGVTALDGVQFDVRRGEVHALVGENGAGKSTLMHILAGVYQPDAGQIDFNGHSNVTIENERAAQDLGVAIVFQERSLFADLSVAENIFAGRQPTLLWGHIRRRQLYADARRTARPRRTSRRSPHASERPLTGPAADGRDRQSPLARRAAFDPRRADRRLDRNGNPRAVRMHRSLPPARRRRHLYLTPPGRSVSNRRSRNSAQRRPLAGNIRCR